MVFCHYIYNEIMGYHSSDKGVMDATYMILDLLA